MSFLLIVPWTIDKVAKGSTHGHSKTEEPEGWQGSLCSRGSGFMSNLYAQIEKWHRGAVSCIGKIYNLFTVIYFYIFSRFLLVEVLTIKKSPKYCRK